MFNSICSAIISIVTVDIIFNRVILNRESVTEHAVKEIFKNLNEDDTKNN